MTSTARTPAAILLLLATAAGAQQTAPTNQLPEVALVPIAPGGGAPQTQVSEIGRRYAESPEHIEAGRRLFSAMNCNGCHSSGGGGMGPPLMDKTWIYGGNVENIAATIAEGRPNGMPSFRALIPMDQIWELAAYVQSLSKHPTEK